jgi:hypothetical protein
VASWAVFRLKPRWAPMLGVRKSEGVPEHKSREQKHTSHERQGDKESLKACTRLKSCESLYTCPRTTFYREMKGHLHFEITLESKEYSQCEHVQECLLHPVICGANFIHYKSATSSHFKPGLLKRRLWLDFVLTPKLLFMKITAHCGSRIKTSPDSRTSQIPDSMNFASFQPFWNRQQIREQEPNKLSLLI